MASEPYVSSFEGKSNLRSSEFIQVFQKYDQDGNGYIEKQELDAFLQDLTKNKTNEEVDREQLEKFKQELLAKYDENSDGKISLKEISRVLPTEQNFLLQYRDEKKINVVDFVKIWYHYDVNRNGYLEANELKGFLHDLEEDTNNPIDPQKLDEYVQMMLEMFDGNKDGRIEFTELSQLLPTEENFLLKFNEQNLTSSDFDEIFQHYDRNGDGYIEGNELLGLLKDIQGRKDGKELEMNELEKLCEQTNSVTTGKDGKLTKQDLRVLLARN